MSRSRHTVLVDAENGSVQESISLLERHEREEKSKKEQVLELVEWNVCVGLSVVTSRGQEEAPSL